MAEYNTKQDLINAGYGGYSGWGETEALADFRATGGQGKFDPSVAGGNLSQDAAEQVMNQIADIINGYEDQLYSIGVPSLTEEELNTFLQKAIEQVEPYYNQKKTEIEAGIKEGRIRDAEDLLMEMRTVRQDIEDALRGYDISQAQNEEELANTLANITATSEEEIATKAYEWGNRIRDTKQQQVESDILTSGIGKQKIGELTARQQEEQAAVARRAGAMTTEAETSAKYDLEKITLARESAQRERVRKLGTPEEEQETERKALEELGLTSAGELPSESELLRRRADRNITTYKPEALTDIEEESKRAIESRKLTLQQESLAQKQAEEEARRRSIEAEIAKKQRELSRYASQF